MAGIDLYCKKYIWMIVLASMVLVSAACTRDTPNPTAIISPSDTPWLPTQTLTPFQPTATPIPLAAKVNGEEITLDQFQAELDRYRKAVGTQLATGEAEQIVLDDLVNQLLLAQAAAQSGFVVDEALLQERIDSLVVQLGDRRALQDWMAANGYTEQSFRQDLGRAIASAWMRDQIIAGIPDQVEQVHALHILLYNREEANQVLAQLRSGEDFATLASEYDPIGKGDLGWFPKGYLTDPKLDEAAFNLQPGEISEVIETNKGFYILQVLERDPARTLEPGARLALQVQAVEQWLTMQRNQSEILDLLP